MNTQITTLVTSSPVDVAISGWLHVKYQRSHSAKAQKAYIDTIHAFRAALRYQGLDLDRVAEREDRQTVAMTAQQYAAWSSKEGKQVAAATFNQRLAILSSFYRYAQKRELVEHNPIESVERAKVQPYGNVQPLGTDETSGGLQSIDRETLPGARDYALLAILLQTGRRLSEVQALTWRNVKISQGRVTLTFEHCKGDKTMVDTLAKSTGEALLNWLHRYHGRSLNKLSNETPLWVSLARGTSKGCQMGIQSIADVCVKHFKTSKVHVMRHTFAHTMEEAGASVSDIQSRLGHESMATTGRYLARLKQAENKHADRVAAMLGIE